MIASFSEVLHCNLWQAGSKGGTSRCKASGTRIPISFLRVPCYYFVAILSPIPNVYYERPRTQDARDRIELRKFAFDDSRLMLIDFLLWLQWLGSAAAAAAAAAAAMVPAQGGRFFCTRKQDKDSRNPSPLLEGP